MTTALVWDERSMWHDSGNHFGPPSEWMEPSPHPESADSKRRIKNLLDASGMTQCLALLQPRPATEEELIRVHTLAYLGHVRSVAANGGGNIATRATTHIGRNGFALAALAAGGAITAVDAVLDGAVDNAYVLMRPPGHHAEAGEGKGFCVFNNAAIAARHAIDHHGLQRVALIDWDAHHGNGAQQIFWDDPRVLCISLHQDRAFPLSVGAVEEAGAGAGLGYTVNVPLPPGSGEGAYLAAFESVVLPALERFAPELIIVPCGFDAGYMDPTARMMLSSESFRRMTALVKAAAQVHCGGRLVLLHEGGYFVHMVPFLALATFEELAGWSTGVQDPFLAPMESSPYRVVTEAQRQAIAATRSAMDTHPCVCP